MFKSDNFIWKYLSSCNVQFFETWTVSANLVEKHVVRDVSFQRQLGEALAIHYHRIEGRAAQIIFREMLILELGYGTCTSTPLVSQTSPHECIFLQRSVKISSVFLNKTAMTMLRSIPSTVFLRFHSFLHFQAIPYSWKNLAPVKVK